jgi:hypothetical protein
MTKTALQQARNAYDQAIRDADASRDSAAKDGWTFGHGTRGSGNYKEHDAFFIDSINAKHTAAILAAETAFAAALEKIDFSEEA